MGKGKQSVAMPHAVQHNARSGNKGAGAGRAVTKARVREQHSGKPSTPQGRKRKRTGTPAGGDAGGGTRAMDVQSSGKRAAVTGEGPLAEQGARDGGPLHTGSGIGDGAYATPGCEGQEEILEEYHTYSPPYTRGVDVGTGSRNRGSGGVCSKCERSMGVLPLSMLKGTWAAECKVGQPNPGVWVNSSRWQSNYLAQRGLGKKESLLPRRCCRSQHVEDSWRSICGLEISLT